MTKVKPKVKAIAWLLCLVYFASYVMRINFQALVSHVGDVLDKTEDEMAVILTALTITYGLGQILCGVLGDKIKPRLMLTIGFGIAISCNVAMFFFETNILAMTIIWGINGFAHAMYWPPIVKLMAVHLKDEEYSYASVRVTWGSSIATILLYLGCSFLIGVIEWRTIMLLCAILGAMIMVVWIVLCPKLFKETDKNEKVNDMVNDKEKAWIKPPRYVFLPLILIMFAIIMQGALRDGVTAWMPDYLISEFQIPTQWSILTTVILAIFSMISFTVFNYINSRFFKNEVLSAAVIFVIATVSSGLLYLSDSFKFAMPSILFMSILVACMHGVNLMLIAIAPKRFKRSGKVSTYSGIMNACTYVGSAIATYGIAKLANVFGWGAAILTWIGIALLGATLCFVAYPKWKKMRKEYDSEE